MTELQIGLIGLGVVAVTGVVVYNTWLEYRHRQLAQKLLQPSSDDVLLGRTDNSGSEDLAEPLQPADVPSGAHAYPDDGGAIPPTEGESEAPGTVEVPKGGNTSPAVPGRNDPVFAARTEPVLKTEPVPGERIEPVLRIDPLATAATGPEFPDTGAEETVSPVVPSIPLSPIVPAHSEPPPLPPVSVAPRKEAPALARPAQEPDTIGDEYREVIEPQHLLLPAVDYIAALEAIEPASAAQILGLQQKTLAHVRKPIHWFGHNEMTREWEAVDAASSTEYRSLRIGLQLVDRRGPVSENDLTVFHVAMQDLAHTLMAIIDMPHRQALLTTATALDEFCAGVDIQIGINVISTASPFPGTKIRALAEAAGMLIEGGRFVRADDDGNILYVLMNQEEAGFTNEAMKTMSTHGLTFLLDVPTVAHGDRIFTQMVELARRFADVLKGALVDDNRRPLSDGALEPIRRQIAQYQATMAARKLPAGGALAKRLFS